LNKALAACLAIATFALSQSARADVVTFQLAGVVTQVPEDDLSTGIAFQDPFQGSFSFDSAAVDQIPSDPATGSYNSNTAFDVSIDGLNFTTDGLLNIGIFNAAVDQYTVFATSADGSLTIELFLQDSTGSVFDNDHLPITPPLLTSFDEKGFHLIDNTNDGTLQVDGTLTSLAAQGGTTTATPEPSQIGLTAVGMLALFAIARCTRSQRTN